MGRWLHGEMLSFVGSPKRTRREDVSAGRLSGVISGSRKAERPGREKSPPSAWTGELPWGDTGGLMSPTGDSVEGRNVAQKGLRAE